MRRLRLLLLLLAAFLPFAAPVAHAETTPTEARALEAAANDHTAYTLTPDQLGKAHALALTGGVLHFGDALWGIVVLVLLLETRTAHRMRNVAINLSKNRWAQGFTFFFLFLFVTTLAGLPFDLYGQHMRRAYGLSVQSWGSWVGDQLKGMGITLVLGGALMMLLFGLIRKFPRRWWLAFWFPVMLFTVLGVFLSPYVIDPLFNKFEPLTKTNPALVDQLEKVVARGKGIDIPPERMFLMKASAKVTTLNAYVTGFGSSKRVVVWDTSIKAGTPDEISFIFGHEMGHYVLGHIVSGILFSFAVLLVSFFLGFHLFQFLLARFGARWKIPEQSNWASFVVLMLVLSVLGFIGEPVTNTYTRTHEHDADVFGQEAVHGIVADPQTAARDAFELLGTSNYADPSPSALSVFWTYSHPPIGDRAAFARHYDPWAADAAPKYFSK